jgi:peptidoglycan/LPS O-acetylase OafA/YrhL
MTREGWLTKETSLYLDVLRFVAAMVVFLGHVSGSRFTGGLLWQLGPFSGEAITVFFARSGFAIGYVTDHRERTATSYVVAEAARIYSVALPALLITSTLDAIGRSIRPELYTASWGYEADGRIWQFLSGLFFVKQVWSPDSCDGSVRS